MKVPRRHLKPRQQVAPVEQAFRHHVHHLPLALDIPVALQQPRVPGGGTMYWLGPYPEGTRVRLVDAEGNSCEAVLDEVDGQILKFRPDWETWSESPSFLVADEPTFGEGGILRDAATAGHPETRPHVAPSEFAFFSARTAARVNA